VIPIQDEVAGGSVEQAALALVRSATVEVPLQLRGDHPAIERAPMLSDERYELVGMGVPSWALDEEPLTGGGAASLGSQSRAASCVVLGRVMRAMDYGAVEEEEAGGGGGQRGWDSTLWECWSPSLVSSAGLWTGAGGPRADGASPAALSAVEPAGRHYLRGGRGGAEGAGVTVRRARQAASFATVLIYQRVKAHHAPVPVPVHRWASIST